MGGGGSKTETVIEYVYEDPKQSITSQQMVDLFGYEQQQAGQQDIFQGADVVGQQARPTPTVTEVARYLKDTTGANVISVPETSLVEGSGGVGTDIEEFQTGQLGRITSDIGMQPKARKPELPELKLPETARPIKTAALRPKTAEQTLTDIEGFSSIATGAQQGGMVSDPSVAQQTAVGFPGSDVSSNLYKQPLAPITEQMQRAKLGAQEGLRVPETLANEPQLTPEVAEGKGDAMGVPQLFNKPGAGKDADDIEAIAEPDDFILNSKVKEIEGEKDIDTMLAGAIDIANKKGYRLSPRITNLPKDKVVPLLVSKDEIRVPKVLAKIIGYDKLTKMNERGKAAMKAEEQQQATGQQVAQAKHGGEVHSQKKKFKEGGKAPRPLEKDKANFLDNAVKVVQSINKDNIVPSPIVLSIIAQETGWGTSRFVKEANNWFNMVVDKPDQKFVPAKDRPSHKVRSFGSGTESVSAFLEMVNTKPHYQPVRDTLIKYNEGNATEHEIIDAIANTGYAEDPNWANSIKDIHDRRIKPMFMEQKEYVSGGQVEDVEIKKDILQQNTEVPFVDRILNPENYIKPKEQIDSEGRSFIETHRMSAHKGFVFPTVVIEDNKYIDLIDRYKGNIDDVLDHNKKTGNIISFPSDEEAQNFSVNYKNIPSAQKFNEYYTPDHSKFEEEDRTNREKIQRKIYDTVHTIKPHVERMVKTGDLPKEQIESFMSNAIKAKVGDTVVNKAKDLGMYPNFLNQIDASAEIREKDDFSVRAGGFEWTEHPYYRGVSKTFGDPEGIHGSVGIDRSKYRDDTYIGGKLVFPLGKPKK